jgi:hypothetical protein
MGGGRLRPPATCVESSVSSRYEPRAGDSRGNRHALGLLCRRVSRDPRRCAGHVTATYRPRTVESGLAPLVLTPFYAARARLACRCS